MWTSYSMTQFSALCPSVECFVSEGWGLVSDRVENVKNSSERQCWWGARRLWRARGKLVSAADERAEEELTLMVLCSGKGIVGAFTYSQHPPPLFYPPPSSHYLQPQGQLPWQQNLPLAFLWQTKAVSHALAVAQVLPVVHTLRIRHFPLRGFPSYFPVWPQRCWCRRNTHIDNLRFRHDLLLTVWSSFTPKMSFS